MSDAERAAKREDRPPAPRCGCAPIQTSTTVTDLLHGSYTGVVDDFVLRRG